MSASVKLDITAYLPADALEAFMQTMTDFDKDHPGCHIQFVALDPGSDLTVDKVDAMMARTGFDFREIIRKQ